MKDSTRNNCPGSTLVKSLENYGISTADISKLQESGLHTIESIAFQTKSQLINDSGISNNQADKIIDTVSSIFHIGFSLASSYYQQRRNLIYIQTGSTVLDSILGGGIESNSVTEVFGDFRSGKTQLCYTLAVTCQLLNQDHQSIRKCLWIDSESTFRTERLIPIADRFHLDSQEVMNNIVWAKAYNTDHQSQLLAKASELMTQSNFSLLIVDSVTNLYRTDYCGKDELNNCQIHLSKFLRKLRQLADEFKIAVLITNQVESQVDGGFTIFNSYIKPIHGNITGQFSQTRLYLQKGMGQTRKCQIYQSPSLPQEEASFAITNIGISDID